LVDLSNGDCCEVRTEFLNIIQIHFWVQRLKQY